MSPSAVFNAVIDATTSDTPRHATVSVHRCARVVWPGAAAALIGPNLVGPN